MELPHVACLSRGICNSASSFSSETSKSNLYFQAIYFISYLERSQYLQFRKSDILIAMFISGLWPRPLCFQQQLHSHIEMACYSCCHFGQQKQQGCFSEEWDTYPPIRQFHLNISQVPHIDLLHQTPYSKSQVPLFQYLLYCFYDSTVIYPVTKPVTWGYP